MTGLFDVLRAREDYGPAHGLPEGAHLHAKVVRDQLLVTCGNAADHVSRVVALPPMSVPDHEFREWMNGQLADTASRYLDPHRRLLALAGRELHDANVAGAVCWPPEQ